MAMLRLPLHLLVSELSGLMVDQLIKAWLQDCCQGNLEKPSPDATLSLHHDVCH